MDLRNKRGSVARMLVDQAILRVIQQTAWKLYGDTWTRVATDVVMGILQPVDPLINAQVCRETKETP